MNVRPVYRWKSFWLGVLVVCFLGWAWWDSTRSETWIQRTVASGVQGIVRVDGVTIVFHGARHFFAFNGVMRLPVERSASEMEEDDFEVWETSYVRIADWMVWMCFAVAWVGWMVWRWRMMRRLTESGMGAEVDS